MKVRIDLEITDDERDKLCRLALIHGRMLRENPRKRMTEAEYKERVRFGVMWLVQQFLEDATP